MNLRLSCIAAAAALLLAGPVPAFGQDSNLALAPADEYFGRYNLSVIGIANAIRDSGFRIDSGADVRAVVEGSLSFVTDALHAWEAKYPGDPWIAKDLLALETVYLKIPGTDAYHLAAQTEAWLVADYPATASATAARAHLAGGPPPAQAAALHASATESPWERFAALRAPLPPPPQ
jgi:hypothetical protein